jgi:3-oxoacyl-[acyl-carrier protein] reductase
MLSPDAWRRSSTDMDLGLNGKVFVIGGGSAGLGRAVAAALVAEGARVLLVSRDQVKLDRVVSELGSDTTTCVADLGTVEGADAMVRAAKTLGGIDGLVVNSGGPPPGEVLDVSDEQWEGAFRLLVGNPIRIIRDLAPEMRNESAVLFITSSSVRVPIPGLDTSNVIRPGVAALANCLAIELAPRIRVNSLAPGRIDTERIRSLDAGRAGKAGITVEEHRARMSKVIPLGRYGEAEELGRVAAFLLSPAASYITGSAIQVDGGYVTATP